jgi:hypothetical protein
MLIINKGVTNGDVVTIKLTSGEELIARLDNEDATHYTLSKPMVLASTATGIGMVPYLFTVDHETNIPLNKSTVSVMVGTTKVYADQYMQSTTGIKLL